jgi:anaerobic selenocysteine-containing dehydrogenase
MCGLRMEHDGQRVLKVTGDQDDVFSKGFICPKGARIHEIHEDPDRLRQPLRKNTDGSWEEISWEEAIDYTANRLNSIREAHGLDAVGLYYGNPTVHNFGFLTYAGEFRRALGSRNVFSATSVDQLPHQYVAHHMFGHTLLIPIPDIDRTDYLIIMGANPSVSNGSLMSSGGVNPKLRAIRERGGKVVVLDPRRTETTKYADEHHFILPGRDVYFLLAMLHLVFKHDWVNSGHLAGHLNGLEELRELVGDFTPEMASELCGISPKEIHKLTEKYATTPRAVIYGRMGLSTQEHGSLCNWLINTLNVLTGNLDREGGAMFTDPAANVIRTKKYRRKYDRWASRVRGLPESEGEFPVAALAEEILTPGQGQIRAMITHAGNPVISTPNGRQLDEAFESLEFMVSIDIFLNETTRHADLILPPPSQLEVDHYDLIFNHLATRNVARFSPPLFPKPEGQLYDWQIAKELIKRLAPMTGKKPSSVYSKGNPRRILNLALQTGKYGRFSSLTKLLSGLSLRKLLRHPHGIDLGPLKPQMPNLLRTTDGRINLLPEALRMALESLRDEANELPLLQGEADQFMLVGRRHLRSNNSWMHNSPSLAKGKERCTLMINPLDAKEMDLEAGQSVLVTSRVGSIELPAELTDDMMPGVVSIPHGFGHRRKGTRLQVASQESGPSVNDITDELRLDPLTGNAAFSGQPVQLTPVTVPST